jgi:hypothetical protein
MVYSAEGEGAEADESDSFMPAWCPAEDQAWIVPDLAAAFENEAAASWHYFAALAGHTYR